MAKVAGTIADADGQHHQTAQKEDGGHHGDDLLRHGGQTLHAAQEDDAADDHKGNAHHPGGNAEGRLEALEPMELDCTMQPKKPSARTMATAKNVGQELAEAALEGRCDVVHGAAVDAAVRAT